MKLMEDETIYLIIPAAGLGKRMKSINPKMPKEMLPIGNKPAIQYAVEEGLSVGIQNIVIIINRKKEIIRRYFTDRRFRQEFFPSAFEDTRKIENECLVTFLYQEDPLGESDAISFAEDVVGNHIAAVIYPDNIYLPAPGALKILKAAFSKYRKDIAALTEVREENVYGFGNSGRVDLSHLEDDIFCVERFIPKGNGHFVPRFKGELRTCGIAISGPHIFEYIKRLRELVTDGELTDVPVRSLILKEKGFLGCRLPGIVFDIGHPEGYKLCLSYIGKKTYQRQSGTLS
jgi:UTP--glucose-1-phosphate uridylyltransferase